MPSKVQFGNKTVLEPGAYTRVIGGVTEAPESSSLGTVLIIDTGLGATWGGGSGINGALNQGLSSVYEFDSLRDFQRWMRGGILWDVAQYIFKPVIAQRGAQKLLFASAKTTIQASLSKTLTNGTIAVKTVAEGVGANGTIVSTHLDTGFAAKMIAGTADSAKFVWQGWVGTYRGADGAGVPLNDTLAANSAPELVVQSPEVANLTELAAWMEEDAVFQQWFRLDAISALTGLGVLVSGDLTTYALSAFSGATETYNTGDLDDLLETIGEVDYTFILCDKYGVADGVDTENTKIFTHITTEAVYEKFMIVGGGADATEFDQSSNSSIAMARYFNSPKVYIPHGNIKKIRSGGGYRTYPTIYLAAQIAGRLAGLEPQVPATWKPISVDGVVHELTLKQREKALLGGVLHLKKVQGQWVVNQEINTMQKNNQMIYPDGTSPEGSIMRIASLLNKELKLNAERQFVGQNVASASPADVKSFVEGYLISRTAKTNSDNLILNFLNVSVTYNNGDYSISYGFTPNGPVNRLFITGIMLNINVSA
jgi:hypothetical protein